ncbi:MAG: acyltransferase [Tepidisphaeraceae bacterium]
MTSTPTTSPAAVIADPAVDYESKKPKAERGIPSLDGIRAVSILIVLISHAFTDKVPGGFGVVVFFFLSGYLITSLLRIEQEKKGAVSLTKFYTRRALRIFPNSYLVLAISFLLGWLGWIWVFDPASTNETVNLRAVLYHAFYLNNYYQTFFDNAHAPHGSGVYWSLAVEEHFYLIWPAAFIVLHKVCKTNLQRVWVLGALCVVSLAWRIVIMAVLSKHAGLDIAHSWAYRNTDARMDSLAYGCILALVGNPYLDKKWLNDQFWCFVAVPIALLVLLASFMVRDSEATHGVLTAPEFYRQTFRYSVQSLALFPLFIAAVRCHDKPLFAWLNWSPLKFLGVLSYSLYLVHLMVIFNVQRWCWKTPLDNKLFTGSVSIAISLVLAVAMYYLLEKPLQGLRKKLH